jgi:hypothetical protein
MQYVFTEQYRKAAVTFRATLLQCFARAPLLSVRTQTNNQTKKQTNGKNHLTPDVEQEKGRVK